MESINEKATREVMVGGRTLGGDARSLLARSTAPAKQRRRFIGACIGVGVLAAASLGYVAGSATPELQPDAPDVKSKPVMAIAAGGEISALSDSEEETFEEYTTPIDEDEVTYGSNVDLSSAEGQAPGRGVAVGDPSAVDFG